MCYVREGANFRGRHTRGVNANAIPKYEGVKSPGDRGPLIVVAGKPLTDPTHKSFQQER